MKLCRFSLPDDPRPRTGIFHDGKVYETDGEKALGVHAPTGVRLLTPIGQAASLRLFDAWGGGGFAYANSGAIQAPESEVLGAETAEVFMAAVVGGLDRDVSVSEAEALTLGFAVLLAFSNGSPLYAPGFVLGPFVVTPEDLAGFATAGPQGNRYALKARLHLAGEVVAAVDVPPAGQTFAEMIREASLGCDLREGDVIAAGPIPGLCLPRGLRDGDEVIAVLEGLGALSASVRA